MLRQFGFWCLPFGLTLLIISRLHHSGNWPYSRTELWPVEMDGKYGFVNQKGQLVIPFRYSFATVFNEHGLATVQNEKNLYGFVNRSGKEVIPCQWEEGGDHYFPYFDKEGYAYVSRDGTIAVIDTLGNLVIPHEYRLPQSRVLHEIFDTQGMIRLIKNHKMGIVDKRGIVVLPFQWEDCSLFHSNGLAWVYSRFFDQWGVVRRDGTVLIPPVWERTEIFENAITVRRTGQSGLCDLEGKLIIPVEWEELDPSDGCGWIIARQGGQWGWIDCGGKIVIKLEWDQVFPFHHHETTVVRQRSKYYVINRKNEKVSALDFEEVRGFFKDWDYAVVSRNKKMGIIDRKGKEVIPLAYDRIRLHGAKNDLISLSKKDDEENTIHMNLKFEKTAPKLRQAKSRIVYTDEFGKFQQYFGQETHWQSSYRYGIAATDPTQNIIIPCTWGRIYEIKNEQGECVYRCYKEEESIPPWLLNLINKGYGLLGKTRKPRVISSLFDEEGKLIWSSTFLNNSYDALSLCSGSILLLFGVIWLVKIWWRGKRLPKS